MDKLKKLSIIKGTVPIWQRQNGGKLFVKKRSVLIFELFNIQCIHVICFLEHEYKHYFEQVNNQITRNL